METKPTGCPHPLTRQSFDPGGEHIGCALCGWIEKVKPVDSERATSATASPDARAARLADALHIAFPHGIETSQYADAIRVVRALESLLT